MKTRDSRDTDRKVSFFPPFRRKTLSIGGCGGGKEGINLRAEETWLMAFLDKPPQVKVQDIFPSEDYVGKCEYSAQNVVLKAVSSEHMWERWAEICWTNWTLSALPAKLFRWSN